MAPKTSLNRGDLWFYSFRAPDKRRPVVILSRQDVIPLLDTVMVAPITSTILGLPSEVVLGIEDGLKHRSAVNLDHVQTVAKSRLSRWIAQLRPRRLEEICRALAVATGCSD